MQPIQTTETPAGAARDAAPHEEIRTGRPSATALMERLKDWPVSELKEVRSALDALIARRAETARAEALAQIQALAADAGLSSEEVVDLLAPKPKRGRRGVLPPKYRDPESGATWSGRGKVPIWMRERMERDGATKEDFLIDPPGQKTEDRGTEGRLS